MRPSAAGGSTADVVLLPVLVGLALLPLLPVFGGWSALAAAVGGLAVGTAVAVVAARRRWSLAVTGAVGLVAYLVAGAALAAPATTSAWWLPGPDTPGVLLGGAVTVWKDLLTLEPPVGTADGLLVAPYLLAVLGSGLAVRVAARTGRSGAWAVMVVPVVLVVSLLLGTREPVLPVVAGTVSALLAVGWAAARRRTLSRRRLLALLLMLAVASYGGVVGGPQLVAGQDRLVLREELVPPFDPRDHPSPLSAFRRFVKDWQDEPLFTVEGLPAGVPVRLATLDAYDGVVWNVAGASDDEGSGRFRRVGDTVPAPSRGSRHEITVQVHSLPMVWLPTVGWTERVEFHSRAGDRSDLRYNDATGAAVLTRGVPDGARWTAHVVVPEVPEDEDVGAAPAASVLLPAPQGVPDAVPLFAGELVGTATSPVLIARTLEQGLAERGFFSHGLTEQGQAPSLSGHGADRMTSLLSGDLMVGDGEQYASAMALMAREMGLPARVVMGFVPGGGGTADGAGGGGAEGAADGGGAASAQGGGPVTVTGGDVAAWVEIAFAGHGWVPFHPTPDEGRTPSEEEAVDQADPQPQVVQPPPPPPEPVQPPPDTDPASTEDTGEQVLTGEDWRAVLLVAAAVGIPLLLLVAPLLVVALAKRRRRRRRRAARDPVRGVVGGWDEVLDQARDLRHPPPGGATRREVAVELSRSFVVAPAPGDAPSGAARPRTRRDGAVGAAMTGLAAGADAAVFGPGQPSQAEVDAYWRQVDGAVAAMRRAVPRRRRWRARWSAASLRARRRERRARLREDRRAARADRGA